jgi:hypothetical protein
MWNFCDDAGIHPKSYKRLKMEVFPGDDITEQDMIRWVSELIKALLLIEYTIGKDDYWQVTGWKKHQRIDRPNYRYPNSELSAAVCIDSSANAHRVFDECSTNYQRILDEHSPPEGKGKEEKGKEKDICEVSSRTSQASLNVSEVFEHWKSVMQHSRAKLDSKRKQKILAALKLGYSIEQLKQAIDGCTKSSFHMGKNEQHKRYNDIALILRDAGHIEQFIDAASENPGSDGLSVVMSEKQKMLIGAL